jgi:hypothetical protein
MGWEENKSYVKRKYYRRLHLFSHITRDTENYREVRGSVVGGALFYRLRGRGFKTRWGNWNLSVYLILPAAIDPQDSSASNRNEYQRYKQNIFLGIRTRPVREADKHTAICESIILDNVGFSTSHKPTGHRACYGDRFTFVYVDVRTSQETHLLPSTAC